MRVFSWEDKKLVDLNINFRSLPNRYRCEVIGEDEEAKIGAGDYFVSVKEIREFQEDIMCQLAYAQMAGQMASEKVIVKDRKMVIGTLNKDGSVGKLKFKVMPSGVLGVKYGGRIEFIDREEDSGSDDDYREKDCYGFVIREEEESPLIDSLMNALMCV